LLDLCSLIVILEVWALNSANENKSGELSIFLKENY
jgi:hypothetical protein